MADETTDRLSDAELWRGVETTVRNVLLPAITDEWARAAAVQLVGVARYAERRPADPIGERLAELRTVLARLDANPLVAANRPDAGDESAHGVLAAVGRVLAAAVDDDGPAGDEVRAVLRPVVVRHLDEELLVTAPLVHAFRGQLDE